MTGPLRTEEQILAAGAAAVADFPPLTDRQVDQVVALLGPVRDKVLAAQQQARPAADAA